MGQCTLCKKKETCKYKKRCEEAGLTVIVCKYYCEERQNGDMGAS